jgi:ribonuclease HII
MARLGQLYPGYDLEKHQGYGTKAHEDALRRLGPCAVHRMSYAPLAAFEKKTESLIDLLAGLPQED